jgi:hypothetical protein
MATATIQRPSNDQPCGRCGCRFGLHYISLDGSRKGCSNPNRYPRGQSAATKRCDCQGFAILYEYLPDVRGALVAAGETSAGG